MVDDDVLDAAEAALEAYFDGGYEPVERDVEPAEGLEQNPDTPELTIDAKGRAHAPDGKFVSLDEVNPQAPTPPEAEEETASPEVSETSTAQEETPVESEASPEGNEGDTGEEFLELDLEHPFFAKYGGDPEKALKALEEAQSLAGRHSQELDVARKESQELTELREQMTALQRHLERQSAIAGLDVEGLLEEDPERLALFAVEAEDANLLSRAVEAWSESEPFRAMMFVQSLQQNLAAQQQPATTTEDLSTAVGALKERYPDLQETLPAIEKLAAERPVLRQALYDGDARSRTQALEDLYLLARSQSQGSDTSTAARKVYLRAQAEADAAKDEAAVVSATNTSAAVTEPEPTANDRLAGVLSGMFGDDEFVIE